MVETISAVFNRAREWGLVTEPNPCAMVKPYREAKRERFLQRDELRPFFEALAAEPSPNVRDSLLLMLLTGARRDNVLGMRWRDVSLERAEWRIEAEHAKNADAQTVVLSDESVAVLMARQAQRTRRADAEPSPFVFPAAGERGFMWPPRKGWQRILTAAGLADIRMHDLRRSLGSWQAKTGASLAIIGKSLGHKSASATMIYARLDADPIRESVARATGAMLAQAIDDEGESVLSFALPTQKAKAA